MPSTCSAVDLTELKKVSDLQVNRNNSNKNTKYFLKKSIQELYGNVKQSNKINDVLQATDPRISENKKRTFKLLKNNNKEKVFKAARGGKAILSVEKRR